MPRSIRSPRSAGSWTARNSRSRAQWRRSRRRPRARRSGRNRAPRRPSLPARMLPRRPRVRASQLPPLMPPSPMASPHEPRGRREGNRGDQSAADGALDRAALAADQGVARLRSRLRWVLLLRQYDLQRADLAVHLGRGPGKLQVHLYRPARIFHGAALARDFRSRVHLTPGPRDADLYVRGARPLSSREAGVPAVSDSDADFLLPPPPGGLCPGVADAGAVVAEP